MTVDSLSKPRQMTVRNRDRLLTLMTVIWILLIFVCAPFQAAGVFVFQTFAVAGMLAIIGAGMFISRNPMALALALEKLAAATGATRSITTGAAHLCIVDPSPGLLSSRQGFLADVIASHPPIRQRIIRLQGMGYQQAKREAAVG